MKATMTPANTDTSNLRTEPPQNSTAFVTQDNDVPSDPEASPHEHTNTQTQLSPERQNMVTASFLVGAACHECHHNRADSVDIEGLEQQQDHNHSTVGSTSNSTSATHAAENSLPHPEVKKMRKHIKGSPRENVDADQSALPIVEWTERQKKHNYIEGEVALIWDASLQDASDLKVVSYFEKCLMCELPASKESESNVAGRMGHAFFVCNENTKNDDYDTCEAGFLVLPPNGSKAAESVGSHTCIFTVCQCLPGSLEVALAHPEEPEGTMDPDTASRFLVQQADMFRIPPGNTYQLENRSTTTECILTWVMIAPQTGAALHNPNA